MLRNLLTKIIGNPQLDGDETGVSLKITQALITKKRINPQIITVKID